MLRKCAAALSICLSGCYVGLDVAVSNQTGSAGSDQTTDPTGPAETSSSSTTGQDESSSTLGVSGSATGSSGVDPTTSTSGDITTGADASTTSTTTSTTTTTTTTTGDPDPDPDVPAGVPYCSDAANWDPAWAQLEEDILTLVNQERAKGANCGSEGMFGPAGPLTMEPHLRCAARVHSKDMDDRNFFSHTNPDGEGPGQRIDKAQYGNYSTWGENIAAGSPNAAGTMNQWMGSDGHCANIMNPDFEHIGVGYHPGGQYGHLWTQVFGAK